MTDAIPTPILDMLKEEWRKADDSPAFDYPFQRRANDPSFYAYRRDDPKHDNNGVRTEEVSKLAKLPMFDGLIRETKEGFSFNEHAQHALTDFCSEVYTAWAKCAERLGEVG
ncbi:hypothetical protein NKL05_27895 [Mesorhizobium sp. C420B]|uniref:hypothetical protein n=1 Tax=unclassified Mesorhizobium TaxID=325217 RepID=UPI000418C9EB|nr:hypothetical protein [Mesorhizobium sp. LSHC420B00]